MAAAAATVTAALSSCRKRESENVGVGMLKKAKRGRSQPKEEEVEAFLTAQESALALRFAANLQGHEVETSPAKTGRRYNYDVVKDAPVDGRYVWVRV